MSLKKLMKYYKDDVVSKGFTDIMDGEPLEFLKGSTKDEKVVVFNSLINDFLDYFINIGEKDFLENVGTIDLSESMKFQEFAVLTGDILDFIIVSSDDKNEVYHNFMRWIYSTLDDVVKEEARDGFFKELSVQKTCIVFYFLKTEYQNVFLTSLVVNLLSLLSEDD